MYSLLTNKVYLYLLVYYNGWPLPSYVALSRGIKLTRQTIATKVKELKSIFDIDVCKNKFSWTSIDICGTCYNQMINNSIHGKSYGKIDVDGWRPVSEYDPYEDHWVLLKTTDCLPIIAKMTIDGDWIDAKYDVIEYKALWFFDVKQLDKEIF